MLVLHPNSTCDVCLDNYSNGTHTPHVITCGHVFCQGCLDNLSKSICPLCRTRFQSQDIRKIHIDRQSPRQTALSHPAEAPKAGSELVEVSHEARRYQTDITRIVKEGAPASELRALIDQCHIWLKTQPHDQHEDLRVSFLLLYNLTETQRKLTVEADSLRGLKVDCENLRTQLDTERDAAERKYSELERSNSDEKETALAIEKSLREHLRNQDEEWRKQYDAVFNECKRLEDDLKRAKYPYIGPSDAPRTVNLRYFYGPPESHMDTNENELRVDTSSETKARAQSKEDMFHLSPLPVNIPPLPSAIIGFSALAEDDEERSNEQKSDGLASPSLSSVEPISIPNKSHASRLSTDMAISVPRTLDLWSSGPPQSMPRTQDVTMGSFSTSPNLDQHMRERGREGRPTDVQMFKPADADANASLSRRFSNKEEHAHGDRDQVDHRRSQLHNLLDNNNMVASSLPTNSQLQSILSSEPGTGSKRSYTTPPRGNHAPVTATSSMPIIGSKPSASPPISASSSLNQSHGVLHNGIPPTRPPLISHASSAAIRLEQDRKEREKERENRERDQDRERDRRHTVTNSSSLRDSTNAYQSHRKGSISSMKARTSPLYA